MAVFRSIPDLYRAKLGRAQDRVFRKLGGDPERLRQDENYNAIRSLLPPPEPEPPVGPSVPTNQELDQGPFGRPPSPRPFDFYGERQRQAQLGVRNQQALESFGESTRRAAPAARPYAFGEDVLQPIAEQYKEGLGGVPPGGKSDLYAMLEREGVVRTGGRLFAAATAPLGLFRPLTDIGGGILSAAGLNSEPARNLAREVGIRAGDDVPTILGKIRDYQSTRPGGERFVTESLALLAANPVFRSVAAAMRALGPAARVAKQVAVAPLTGLAGEARGVGKRISQTRPAMIEQALKDLSAGRVTYLDETKTYFRRNIATGKNEIAPWNRDVLAEFASEREFYDAMLQEHYIPRAIRQASPTVPEAPIPPSRPPPATVSEAGGVGKRGEGITKGAIVELREHGIPFKARVKSIASDGMLTVDAREFQGQTAKARIIISPDRAKIVNPASPTEFPRVISANGVLYNRMADGITYTAKRGGERLTYSQLEARGPVSVVEVRMSTRAPARPIPPSRPPPATVSEAGAAPPFSAPAVTRQVKLRLNTLADKKGSLTAVDRSQLDQAAVIDPAGARNYAKWAAAEGWTDPIYRRRWQAISAYYEEEAERFAEQARRAVAPVIPAPAVKQPWEMTRDEYRSVIEDIDLSAWARGETLPDPSSLGPHRAKALAALTKKRQQALTNIPSTHRFWVSEAISEGKPVPPEVLADYPDLAAQAGRAAPRVPAVTKAEAPVARLPAKRYILRQEPEPLFPSGRKYAAYYEDGTPAYQAAETPEALRARIRSFEPDAIFIPKAAPPTARAPVATTPAEAPGVPAAPRAAPAPAPRAAPVPEAVPAPAAGGVPPREPPPTATGAPLPSETGAERAARLNYERQLSPEAYANPPYGPSGIPPRGPGGLTPPAGAPPPPPSGPLNEAVRHLKELVLSAKPVRAASEELMSAERGRRAAMLQSARESGQGREAVIAGRRTLGGELPRARWTPPGDAMPEAEQKALFEAIRTNTNLRPYDYLNTSSALEKVLGGVPPTTREMQLLEAQFGSELARALLTKRPLWQKVLSDVDTFYNLSRRLKFSIDLAYHGIQGYPTLASETKIWARAWGPTLRSMWKDRNYAAIESQIKATPMFTRALDRGMIWKDPLSITGGTEARAEGFIRGAPGLASELVDKMGGTGQVVKRVLGIMSYPLRVSERAFSMAGNYMRFQRNAKEFARLDAMKAPSYMYDATATLSNIMTGQAAVPKSARAVMNLASQLFSAPGLATSIVQTWTAPLWLRGARVQSAAVLGKTVGYTAATIMAGKAAGLWDTETDPRSTFFMRVKIKHPWGETWYSPLGDYQNDVRLVVQLVSGQSKALRSGDIREANRLETLARFAWGKLHPGVSTAVNVEQGQNVIGEPRGLGTFDQALVILRDLYAPLTSDQVIEAYLKGGPALALITAVEGAGLRNLTIEDGIFDKAAKQKGFGDEYAKLPAMKRAEIRVDPKVREEVGKRANDPVSKVRWEEQEAQVQRDAFLDSGKSPDGKPYNWRRWLDALHDSQQRLVATREISDLMRPVIERGASDPLVQAVNGYFELQKQFQLPGKTFDREGWEDAEANYLLKYDKKMRGDIREAVGSSTSPKVVAYYELLDKAQEYFDVEDMAIGPDPQTRAAYEQYKAENQREKSIMRKANQRLDRALDIIERERKRIRTTDADVDLYLHLFRGGTLTVRENLPLARAGKLTFAGVPVPYTPPVGAGVPEEPKAPRPIPQPVFKMPAPLRRFTPDLPQRPRPQFAPTPGPMFRRP